MYKEGLRQSHAGRIPKRGRLRLPHQAAGYLFIAPALAFLLLLVAVPISRTLSLSVEDIDFRTRVTTFVGLKNYFRLLADYQFWFSLYNSFLFALGSTIGHALMGLMCALLLQGDWAPRGVRNFVRGMMILPWLFSLAAASCIWGLLYQSSGPLNYLLIGSGLVRQPIEFFGDSNLALWSLAAINIWRAYPFYLMMILGGLQTIPTDLYEAARIDGAGPVQRFWHVTLPLLRPVLVASTALDMITTFTTFDLVKIMTNGGPMRSTQTLAFYIWQMGLRDVQFGYGSAMSIAMLVILSVATLFYLQALNRKLANVEAGTAI
jgi:multiple sugar transport system permease protein